MLWRLAAIWSDIRPSYDPLCVFRLRDEYRFWTILNDIRYGLNFILMYATYCKTFRIYLLITGT